MNAIDLTGEARISLSIFLDDNLEYKLKEPSLFNRFFTVSIQKIVENAEEEVSTVFELESRYTRCRRTLTISFDVTDFVWEAD